MQMEGCESGSGLRDDEENFVSSPPPDTRRRWRPLGPHALRAGVGKGGLRGGWGRVLQGSLRWVVRSNPLPKPPPCYRSPDAHRTRTQFAKKEDCEVGEGVDIVVERRNPLSKPPRRWSGKCAREARRSIVLRQVHPRFLRSASMVGIKIQTSTTTTLWPSGLRRWPKAPFREGVAWVRTPQVSFFESGLLVAIARSLLCCT